ncbi:glycosyltransferase [Bacteroidales bacterium OttesenSCG-928-M11]|nr:glycosyltransferase [Bacteroidales bacterium OttesenSCG-928-M11]
MKVSVVIPIYNVAGFIERCLLSAFNQTYLDIEYILVNDATPDNSMEIVNQTVAPYLGTKEIAIINHPKNKGLGAARNSGVKAAKGNYIFFLDSDDEIPQDSIEQLVASMGDYDVDVSMGEIKVSGAKRSSYPPLLLKQGVYTDSQKIFDTYLRKQWYEMAWNKLIKRDLFIQDGLWFNEQILHEDTLWSFFVASRINSLAVCTAETYCYHIQDNSITQKKSIRNTESFYFLIEEIIKESKEKNFLEKYPSLLDYLEKMRVYFIKILMQNSFDGDYILIKKQEVDSLFAQDIWTVRRQTLLSRLKEKYLTIQLKHK